MLPTSDHGVTGSNPAGSEILPELKWRLIAYSLSCSPFRRPDMTEILLTETKNPNSSIHLLESALNVRTFLLSQWQDMSINTVTDLIT